MRAPPLLNGAPLAHLISAFGAKPRAAAHGVCGEGGYDAAELAVWPPPPPPRERGALHEWLAFALQRLRILVVAVPLALLVVLIRWGNLRDSGAETPVEAVVLPPLITAAVFVMATVLSNVMADYKESEKVPAELLSYFNALLAFARTEGASAGFDELPMLLNIEDMLLCVLATLDRKVDFSRALAAYHESFVAFSVYAQGQALHNGGHIDLTGPEHAAEEIVKKWTRIHDIGRLSIILPGYTLMDLLTYLLVALLASVSYKDIPSSGYWAIALFGTIIIYLNILVRALDDPFDGPEDFHFLSYARCARQAVSLADTYNYSLSIDFECLTVSFGSILRRLINEHEGSPVPGASARGGGIGADGAVAQRARRGVRPRPPPPRHGGEGAPHAAAHAHAHAHVAGGGAAGAGAAPLPPGWVRHADENDVWYTDAAGNSAWEVPPAPA